MRPIRSTEESALRILFICTANICRSPIAERLSVLYARRTCLRNLSAFSAGTHAIVDSPIHPYAARVIEEFGGDATSFSARQHSPAISSDVDLVLTMTMAHRDAVLNAAPRELHKTFTLAEAARLAAEFDARSVADLSVLRPQLALNESADIKDPIGGGPEIFAIIGSQIRNLLPPILELCRSSASIAE